MKFSLSVFTKKRLIFVKMDDYVSFSELIIVYWLWILEKSFYGLPNIIFEKSIFYDENQMLNPKNEKYHFFFILYYHLTMNNLVWKISNVSHFLDLTFDFCHKKWTSQKWCLEIHRTFYQEFRINKRLSILKRIRNRQFLTKNEFFVVKIMKIALKNPIWKRPYTG